MGCPRSVAAEMKDSELGSDVLGRQPESSAKQRGKKIRSVSVDEMTRPTAAKNARISVCFINCQENREND